MADLAVISPQDGSILDAVRAAVDSGDQAKAAVQQVIMAIVKAGQMLAAKKLSLEHGDWLPWIDQNVTSAFNVREETVRRWIKLAAFCELKGGDIEDAQSITQAYRLAGILPEPEPTVPKGSANGGSLVILERIELSIETRLGQIDPDERDQLCTRLRRLADRVEAGAGGHQPPP